jgi:hypothetical protein
LPTCTTWLTTKTPPTSTRRVHLPHPDI